MPCKNFLIAFRKLFNQNKMQICYSVALVVLFIAHLLKGSDVLQCNRMSAQEEKEGTTAKVPFPQVTRRAPHFEGTAVVNKELVTLSLSQFAGSYVVLLFYALDFSSVCPTELTEFSDREEEFRKLNTVVIACSVDSPYAHLTWLDMPKRDSGLGNVKIPLLSDLTHKISTDYGVYLPEFGHSLRAQFIIDAQGILRQSTINDLFILPSVDETLRLIRDCRNADMTGEPCPTCLGKSAVKSGKYTAMTRFFSKLFEI